MSAIAGKAAVVGIGHSKILRRAETPLGQLAVEACKNAVADAGLKLSDIDGVSCCPSQPFEVGEPEIDGLNHVSPSFIIDALKLEVSWNERAFGQVGHSLIEAVHAVAAGGCNYALVFRAMYNPVGRRYGAISPSALPGPAQFNGPYGLFAPANYAFLFRRYMEKYGAKREQMGAFIVRNRAQALKYEYGYWYQHGGKPLTLDEYMNARIVTEPITIFDCDIPVQGVTAWVVTTGERARDLKHKPAYVLATGGLFRGARQARSLEEYIESAKLQGRGLWRNSGLTPKDVSVLNVYDGFSMITPLWVEGLGFCKEGEAFEFIANPPLPFNTAAGNLGSGRMHGTPHLVDGPLQVMGRAGARQVPNVEIAMSVVMPAPGEGIVFSKNPGR